MVGPAVVAQLDALHAAIERFWAAVDLAMSPGPEEGKRTAFELGVCEIAANIVRYAYPPTLSLGGFEVRLQLYADRLEALLSDQGEPFIESPPHSTDIDPKNLPEGGLGLPLARRALDRVEYTRTPHGLNRWRLVKAL